METKKQDLRRIILYIIITFGLTWLYCLLVIYPLSNGASLSGVPAVALQLLVAAAMFFPAIGVYFTADGGNPFVGPAPTGIIGIIPFALAAIFMVLHLKKDEKGTA